MRRTAYKLLRLREDGTLSPIFINKTLRIPFNKWLEAESHPTKGYAYRPGWHTTSAPHAPHIKAKPDRVWCVVEIENATELKRPDRLGGVWWIAERMKVISFL